MNEDLHQPKVVSIYPHTLTQTVGKISSTEQLEKLGTGGSVDLSLVGIVRITQTILLPGLSYPIVVAFQRKS